MGWDRGSTENCLPIKTLLQERLRKSHEKSPAG
jgi:hypothetical protein